MPDRHEADGKVAAWYDSHRADYRRVKERLTAVRNVLLRGRRDCAKDLLRTSSVYAVLSIQTSVSRHERAFTAYYATDMGIKEAAAQTNYGYQKGDWLRESLATFDYGELLDFLRVNGGDRMGDYAGAHQYLVDNFKGLGAVKAAFTLSMCGVWELMCPDTNIRQFVGHDKRIRNVKQHMEVSEKFISSLPSLHFLEPFMLQWVVFDYVRGEHSDHKAYWAETLPAYSFD